MKITVYSRGTAHIDVDADYQEPGIRDALAPFLNGEASSHHVAEAVTDLTDTERSDVSHDEYAVVSEDDGTELWRGWLSGDPSALPPDPAGDDSFRCPGCGSPQPSMHPAISGGGEVTRICVHPFHAGLAYTPAGYQGPAQHTYTAGCNGFHEPGQCPRAGQPAPEQDGRIDEAGR